MFQPKNEMGVVCVFSQICAQYGFEIVEIKAGYPDVLALNASGEQVRIELEYLASNFISHRHDPIGCDLIVCWVNDLGDRCPIPILELSTGLTHSFSSDDDLYVAFLRFENKYLRRVAEVERIERDVNNASRGGSVETAIYAYLDANSSSSVPGPSAVARELNIAKSYASKKIKDWLNLHPEFLTSENEPVQ